MNESSPATTAPAITLTNPLAIHVVGAGGAGMNAIGVVLTEMGHQVTGSDLRESLGVTRLRAMGAQISIGHDASNVGDVDVVAHSTAIASTNPELAQARDRGIPVWRRADILRAICALKRTVAVAGTHGKTTTSSMLSLCLVNAGQQPSFLVGGDLNEIGSSAVWDNEGELFVVEADESDGTFLQLNAQVALVTNIEPDHLGYYGSKEALYEAFEQFVAATELAILCIDDAETLALAQRLSNRSQAGADASAPETATRIVTYGCHSDADYQLCQVNSDRQGVSFEVVARSGSLGAFTLPLPGLHNALNATGAIAAALEVSSFEERPAEPQLAEPQSTGPQPDKVELVREALSRFGGVARRFERRGESNGVTFIDDYAHLPTEVDAAITAACTGNWDRVVAVFQPHRYSRTASLWQDFAHAFQAADLVVITSIYSAGEQPQPGITGDLIVRAILGSHPYCQVAYIPGWTDLRSYLESLLRSGDLCLTLGAGDLTTLPEELLNA